MKQSIQARIQRTLHMDYFQMARCSGEYDIPTLRREVFSPEHLVGFNYASRAAPPNTGLHFFLDDYQFERVWNEPKRYLARLSKFDCVLTPDFSLFTDMPAALKIYNTYRNRLLGQVFQDAGLRVIPTVSWAERASFRYCFDGIPTQSAVAISALGAQNNPSALHLWHEGVDALLERLEPVKILFYGYHCPIERDYGHAEVIHYKNSVTDRMDGN